MKNNLKKVFALAAAAVMALSLTACGGGSAETPAPEGEEKAEESSILDREVIGKAKTNRAANVRSKPDSGAKLVRQLSKRIDLLILDQYQDAKGNIWYEVSTETGKTHGFVRDYLLDVTQIDKAIGPKTYGE